MNKFIKSISVDEIKIGRTSKGEPTGRAAGVMKVELYGYDAEWLNQPVQDTVHYVEFTLDKPGFLQYDCAEIRQHLEEAYDVEANSNGDCDDEYFVYRGDDLDLLDAEIFSAVEAYYSKEVGHENQ